MLVLSLKFSFLLFFKKILNMVCSIVLVDSPFCSSRWEVSIYVYVVYVYFSKLDQIDTFLDDHMVTK